MVLFPFEIAVVLSQVCHLQAARLLPADVETEAGALELMLVLVDEGRASRPWVIHLWKLAARALVYQRLRRVGPLHPVLQSVGADLVREFGCRYPPGESAVEKSLALPLFLAGSLALGQADRDVVRTRWATLKPERGWQEPLALLERVWSEMDATGDSVRWVRAVCRCLAYPALIAHVLKKHPLGRGCTKRRLVHRLFLKQALELRWNPGL